jgi:hypothetical protein
MMMKEVNDTSNPQEGSRRDSDASGEEAMAKRRRAKAPLASPSEPPETKSPSQWILRRQPNAAKEATSMILMDHLGDTSAMVESLTHQLDSWSLISQPKKQQTSRTRNETRKRAKDSKRAVMKALLL